MQRHCDGGVVKAQIERKFLSVTEAAAMTGISRWTWRRMGADRRITTTKIGTRVLIPIEEINRLAAEGARPQLKSAA
jgi:excisionase family DNA binding protein